MKGKILSTAVAVFRETATKTRRRLYFSLFAPPAIASAKAEDSIFCVVGLENKLHGYLVLQPRTMIETPHVFTGKIQLTGL